MLGVKLHHCFTNAVLMMDELHELLKDWNDPLGSRTMDDAEELVSMLLITLSGKEAVIKALQEDIAYYRKLS